MGKKETINNRNRMRQTARRVTFMGLLFALAMVLSLVEGMVTAGLTMIPGVKLGLSNVVTMYCLFFLGRKPAYTLAVLKALFVMLTRGPVAGALSFSGGILSVTVMVLLMLPKRLNISYTILSIGGAVTHNIVQFTVAVYILGVVSYRVAVAGLPVLAISGVIMGVLTGIVLRLVLPPLKALGITIRGKEET